MKKELTFTRDLLNCYDESVSIDTAVDIALDIENAMTEMLNGWAERVQTVAGPTYMYGEYVPPPNVPFSKIAALQSELEYRTGSTPLRICAPVDGRRVFAVEAPMPERKVLGLRTLLSSPEYTEAVKPAFPVGAAADGSVGVCRLDRISCMLVGGRTGSGKNEFLHDIILGLMYGSTPAELRFILIDTKAVDFLSYAHSPYLLFDSIITDPEQALEALEYAVNETDRRYAAFVKLGTPRISDYNEKADVKLPHIVIVISEFAVLQYSSVSHEIEHAMRSLMMMARAAGIHIVLATELVSADVVRGTIKANASATVAFKTNTDIESRILLNRGDARSLIGCGDVLYGTSDSDGIVRLQTGFVTDEEVERVVISAKNKFDAHFEQLGTHGKKSGDAFSELKHSFDPIVPKALAAMIDTGKCSIVAIQRAFRVGFNRAVAIRDYCEEHGYVEMVGNEYRVNITREKLRELFGEDV